MRTTNDNSWLLPYLEGTLGAEQTAEIEARLAADPRLYAEAEHLRRTLDSLQETASRAPLPAHAAPPADLWPRLRARIVLEPVPRQVTPTRLWWAGGASLAAASLILVGIFWHPQPQVAEGEHIRPMAASRQIARETPTQSKAAKPQAVRPVVLPPRQIAAAPKPPASVPVITLADPFAVPKPLTPPMTLPKPPQVAQRVPSSVTATAQKPPVQVASSGATVGRPPELADSYYAHTPSAPVLAAPPALPAPLVPPSPLELPAPAAAPPSSASNAPAITAKANSAVVTADRPQKAKPQPNALVQARQATPQAKLFSEVHSAGLDDWQAALAGAMHPPLWGESAGMQQANQALLDTQMAGRLNDLQTQLETQRRASPRDVIAGRMLAAVNDFGGSPAAALEERRRIVTLDGSDGEDWFALAQSEERAGNGNAARAAYQHALASSVPPPPFHAAIARQRSQ